MRRALALVVVPFAAAAAVSCGANSCPPGSRRTDVVPLNGMARSPGFVCLPLDVDTPTGADSATPDASPPPSFGEQADAASAPFDASPRDGTVRLPEACGIGQPGDVDVRFVSRSGLPQTPTGAPPDGGYVLVQATFWVADGGDSPIAAARAELAVEGARLVLTAKAAEANVEAATVTLAAGVVTTVCIAAGGPVTSALVPRAGASAGADMGWDGRDLDLVVATGASSFELVFRPAQ